MGRGGTEGSEGQGGARDSSCQGISGDRKLEGGLRLHGRVDGGAEELKVASGGGGKGMEWLASVEYVGEVDCNEAGLVMDWAGGDGEHYVKDRAGHEQRQG